MPNEVRMYHASECFHELQSIVKDYFSTENFGVKEPSEPRLSSETVRARYLLESTTKKIEGRYESSLLWRSDDIILPDIATRWR